MSSLPQVIDFIPESTHFDFPELLASLLDHEAKVIGFQSDAYWMDVGRPADYEKANEDFPIREHEFLKSDVEYEAVGTRI